MRDESALDSKSTSPLRHKSYTGVELATFEALRALAATRRSGCSISVVAHPDTLVPHDVDLIPLYLPKCPEEYLKDGDGLKKWLTIATEAALYSLEPKNTGKADVVHTFGSEAIGSTALAKKLGASLVRTLHLMPWFPGYSITADWPSWCIYVSDFQRDLDRWRRPGRASTIRNYIPVSKCSNLSKRSNAVSVGRVECRKGHFEAAAISQSLKRKLLIVGEVLDNDYAEEISKHFGDTVQFTGVLSREDVLQPFAGAMFTVGIRVSFGSGRIGLGPNVDSSGTLALSLQAATRNIMKPAIKTFIGTFMQSSPQSFRSACIPPGMLPKSVERNILRRNKAVIVYID